MDRNTQKLAEVALVLQGKVVTTPGALRLAVFITFITGVLVGHYVF